MTAKKRTPLIPIYQTAPSTLQQLWSVGTKAIIASSLTFQAQEQVRSATIWPQQNSYTTHIATQPRQRLFVILIGMRNLIGRLSKGIALNTSVPNAMLVNGASISQTSLLVLLDSIQWVWPSLLCGMSPGLSDGTSTTSRKGDFKNT